MAARPFLPTQVQHAHGIEVDTAGNIYVTYVNWNNGIQTNGTDQHCVLDRMPWPARPSFSAHPVPVLGGLGR